MRALAEYIVSVAAAAILCGILNSVMTGSGPKGVMKLVTGLFLAFCVIRPIMDLHLPDFTELPESIREEAEEAAAEGEALARESMSVSITEQLETYILDRAGSMGLDLQVQVVLKEDNSWLPDSVILTGDAPAAKQKALTGEIIEALGIPEEDIVWN